MTAASSCVIFRANHDNTTWLTDKKYRALSGAVFYNSHMHTETSYPLAPLTSFKAGGSADTAIILDDISQFDIAIKRASGAPFWFLGFGSNSLVSDQGLRGTTFIMRTGMIRQEGELTVADAGVWWDDLVQYAIGKDRWGLECMSAIPGGVGAAVVGNIAAYGQAVADTLEWVELCDSTTGACRKAAASELGLQYRKSELLQTNRSLIVLRAAFKLRTAPARDIEYESALVIARENGYDLTTLQGRRDTIIKARNTAGSLWDYRDDTAARTAGSFFRNPLVDAETAERIMSYDETGKSLELLKKMNQVHGGASSRVSAAHVLLAAGFTRGQTWGDVRLHPQHVLKIENAGNATAQEIYAVAQEIIATVKTKLGVDLEPEIRFLGNFDD